MLDGYGDICAEPTTHHFRDDSEGYAVHCINPAHEQAWADRSDLIEMEPVLPELGPVEAGAQDAYDRTPDWTRASGDPVYRRSLILTLMELAGPPHSPARMTNATGLGFDEAMAMSGAPDAEEW